MGLINTLFTATTKGLDQKMIIHSSRYGNETIVASIQTKKIYGFNFTQKEVVKMIISFDNNDSTTPTNDYSYTC